MLTDKNNDFILFADKIISEKKLEKECGVLFVKKKILRDIKFSRAIIKSLLISYIQTQGIFPWNSLLYYV